MIFVRAVVKIKPGMMTSALGVYRDFVGKVLSGEPGCLAYVPTVDVDTGLPNQMLDPDLITVFERWKTIEDFRAHLAMAHTDEFRIGVRALLAEPVSITVSRRAL